MRLGHEAAYEALRRPPNNMQQIDHRSAKAGFGTALVIGVIFMSPLLALGVYFAWPVLIPLAVYVAFLWIRSRRRRSRRFVTPVTVYKAARTVSDPTVGLTRPNGESLDIWTGYEWVPYSREDAAMAFPTAQTSLDNDYDYDDEEDME